MDREAIRQHRADHIRNDATEHLANTLMLTVMLAKRAPKDFTEYHIAIDAAAIQRMTRTIQSLAVSDCNRGLSKRQLTRRQNLADQIEIIAEWYGLRAECWGDLGGAVVYLKGEGVRANGWGDGFGVAP